MRPCPRRHRFPLRTRAGRGRRGPLRTARRRPRPARSPGLRATARCCRAVARRPPAGSVSRPRAWISRPALRTASGTPSASRELGDRKARAGKLGSERLGSAGHGPNPEHPCLVGDPDRNCVRSGELCDGLPDGLERAVELALAGCAATRRGKRFEPLLGDPIHSALKSTPPSNVIDARAIALGFLARR